MKASLLNKLEILQDRFEELTALLGDAEVISDQTRFRAYSPARMSGGGGARPRGGERGRSICGTTWRTGTKRS